MTRIKGRCDFVVFLYLFIQLLYIFLQDVFTMFSGKPVGVVHDRELPLPMCLLCNCSFLARFSTSNCNQPYDYTYHISKNVLLPTVFLISSFSLFFSVFQKICFQRLMIILASNIILFIQPWKVRNQFVRSINEYSEVKPFIGQKYSSKCTTS